METDLQLKKIFSEVFEIDINEINSNTKQNSLEAWDSLGQLRLIMKLEEVYGINFDINDIADLNTFGKIEQYINQK